MSRKKIADSETAASNTALIRSRASAEVIAIITRERERAARRERHFHRMRHDADFAGDIHAYSGLRIGADGARGDLGDGFEEIGDDGAEPMDIDPPDGGDDNDDDNDDGDEDGGDAPPPAAPAQPVSGRRSLHETVLECIERRVHGVALPMDQITARMTSLITATFPTSEEQTRAMRIVAEGMNDRNERILGLTLNFLTSGNFPQSSQTLWLQGFLVESIAVNSCNPGAMERIVTGLRGVDDPELNQVFRLAEGPNLARIFLMGTFNVFFSEDRAGSRESATRNAQHLARELVDRGATAQTTAEEAGALLLAYARAAVAEYGVGNMDATVTPIIQSVEDGYEDFVQPHVLLEISAREAIANTTTTTDGNG